MTTTNQQNLKTSLSSLAMLSLQLQQGRDYLDYLRGFVVECLRQIGDQPFDAASVQVAVEKEFGLRIPAATFALYLKRLVKSGAVVPTAGGLQFRVGILPNLAVNADRESAKARIQTVITKLMEFVNAKYHLGWDEQASASALTEFLREYSIEFVRFAESKSPLPEPQSDGEKSNFVVASFITACASDQPALFESVKILVQSHILSNAFLCPDLREMSQGFKGVTFVVDTRLLLKAFDLESEYDTINTRRLLATIQDLKGVLCVFPETKDEVRSVLKAVIRAMQQGTARGVIERELQRRGRSVADVILAESSLEQQLVSLRISTLPTPRYDPGNYHFQIDEAELRAELEDEIGFISEKAEEHDIRAVRHIFALRRGRRVSRIEDAGYVFLTTNSALSRAAFQYERRNSEGWIFSAVVTDYHLSHLAWLKSPVEAADLPTAEILASCYAAMRPHESFWRRYLEELDRLDKEGKFSEHAHEVLRYSLNAPDELMDVTRGEVNGINERNLHVILEKLEKTYALQKEQQLEKERQEHETTRKALQELEERTKQRDLERAQAVKREEALRRARSDQEAATAATKRDLLDAQAKLEASRQLMESHRARLSQRAHTLAKRIAWSCFAILALICVLFATSDVLPVIPSLSTSTRHILRWSALALGLCDLVLGLSVKEITKRLEQRLDDRFQRALARTFGTFPVNDNPFKPTTAREEETKQAHGS